MRSQNRLIRCALNVTIRASARRALLGASASALGAPSKAGLAEHEKDASWWSLTESAAHGRCTTWERLATESRGMGVGFSRRRACGTPWCVLS